MVVLSTKIEEKKKINSFWNRRKKNEKGKKGTKI